MVRKQAKIDIPPPPGAGASAIELAAYFEKYKMKDFEAAGYVRDLLPDEQREMDDLAMECQARTTARKNARTQLNLAMSSEQLDRFIRYADRKHIPPSTLAKAWILERLDQEAKEA
jgi:hypothetical protein